METRAQSERWTFDPLCRRRLLFIGSERPDEFAHARRLAAQGHMVMVVNRDSPAAAEKFRRDGGRFIRIRVEHLPQAAGRVPVICENYPFPYPTAWKYGTARAFMIARLSRLLLGGIWVVFTESLRLVSALAAVARNEPAVARRFRMCFAELTPALAPPSTYLRTRN